MTDPESRLIRRDVSPLELFFDLVFVLAIGQLTHHLVLHLSWRGGLETLALLVTVCGVWVFTSFEVTLLDIERIGTRAVTVTVMGLCLFMNAGIDHAFGASPWLFVGPMLVALVGPSAFAALASPNTELRHHFARVLVWFAVSSPLWIVGATMDPTARLGWWTTAAAVDLLGVWTAHPLPGRAVMTTHLPFDGVHMLERMRLFLIILLGEAVLSLGRAISEHHGDAQSLLMAAGGFVALVCLWLAYFGGAEQEALAHTLATEDPIRSTHVGINTIYGVVAGLVLLAAGLEDTLAHASDDRSGAGGVLVLAGPVCYLVAQAVYFRLETGTGWRARVVGAAALGLGAVAAYWLPAYAVVALATGTLVAVAVYLSRPAAARS